MCVDQVRCGDRQGQLTQVKRVKVWGVGTRKLLEGAAAKLL